MSPEPGVNASMLAHRLAAEAYLRRLEDSGVTVGPETRRLMGLDVFNDPTQSTRQAPKTRLSSLREFLGRLAHRSRRTR